MVMDEQGKLCCNQHNTITLADGWYLRDSKSNPGRKYYFNPITKQSFWHITDDEIKVLEKRTRDQVNNSKGNKPTHPHTSLMEVSTSVPKLDHTMHPLIYVNGIPYNPNMWTVPPHPKIISSVLLNSANTLLHSSNRPAFVVTQNNIQTNIPCNTDQIFNSNIFPSKFDNKSQKPARPRATYIQKNAHTVPGAEDLREELKNRRFNSNNPSSSNVNVKWKNFESITWDEETVKNVLLFLKRKLPPTTNQDCWYVVPDTNVIERHSTLITMMTNLDTVRRCCLKVPPLVLAKLKNIAQKPGNETIRRFVRFHCTETVQESESESNEISSIRNTCKKLLDDNYHVVVLCQDKLFKDLRTSLTNPIFTIPKMMSFISHLKLNSQDLNKIPQGTVLTSSEIKHESNNDKKCINVKNTLATSQKLNEETNSDLQFKEEFEVNSTSSNSFTQIKVIKKDIIDKPDSINVNTSINQKYPKIPQKRNIKLKKTCDNKVSSVQSVRRRWSAINPAKRNKHNENSNTEQYFQKNEVSNNSVKDNVCKETELHIENKTEIRIGDSGSCKIVSDNESVFNTESAILENNTELNKNNDSKITYDDDDDDDDDKCKSSIGILDYEPPKFTEEFVLKLLTGSGTEWITRFMNIIENTLLRVLRQQSPCISKDIPQVQRLHNATIEVIKNYSHCCYVVDAANKLSMKLMKLSSKGDILNSDHWFQEADIYFHGVNLIKSLQDINQSDEEIQSAITLLRNIITDIQRPIHVEDQVLENSVVDEGNADIVDAPMPELHLTPIKEKADEIDCNKDPVITENTKSDEDAKILHFKALKLRKVDHTPPKIVLNETIDVFDGPWSDSNHTARLESSGDYIETEKSKDEDRMVIDYEEETIEPQDFLNDTEHSHLAITNNADNEKFKLFVGMFLKEIRETFILCAQHIETSLTQDSDNNDVSEELHDIYALLCKMWQSLDSILKRETGEVNNNFKSLLNKAGFDINIDQNMCDEYSDIVRKCRDEVKAFLNLIESRGIHF